MRSGTRKNFTKNRQIALRSSLVLGSLGCSANLPCGSGPVQVTTKFGVMFKPAGALGLRTFPDMAVTKPMSESADPLDAYKAFMAKHNKPVATKAGNPGASDKTEENNTRMPTTTAGSPGRRRPRRTARFTRRTRTTSVPSPAARARACRARRRPARRGPRTPSRRWTRTTSPSTSARGGGRPTSRPTSSTWTPTPPRRRRSTTTRARTSWTTTTTTRTSPLTRPSTAPPPRSRSPRSWTR